MINSSNSEPPTPTSTLASAQRSSKKQLLTSGEISAKLFKANANNNYIDDYDNNNDNDVDDTYDVDGIDRVDKCASSSTTSQMVGIFSKVWSLVKVGARVKHSKKKQSADFSNFIPATSRQRQQQHCRRSESFQVTTTTTTTRLTSNPNNNNYAQLAQQHLANSNSNNNSRRLANYKQAFNSSNNNCNSTSSGVSSTTSRQLLLSSADSASKDEQQLTTTTIATNNFIDNYSNVNDSIRQYSNDDESARFVDNVSPLAVENVYSQPLSVSSVEANARKARANRQIVKSFSTQNFKAPSTTTLKLRALAANNNSNNSNSKQLSSPTTSDECECNASTRSTSTATATATAAALRAHLLAPSTSSSSDESTAASIAANIQCAKPTRFATPQCALNEAQFNVRIDKAVHYHVPFIESLVVDGGHEAAPLPPPPPPHLPHSASLFDYRQLQSSCNDNKQTYNLLQNKNQNLTNINAIANFQQAATNLISDCNYSLAQALIEFGAGNARVRDSIGRTPLMLAVLSNNLAAIRCLLERGAEPSETVELTISNSCNNYNNDTETDVNATITTSALDLAATNASLLDAFELLVAHCSQTALDKQRADFVDGRACKTRLLERLVRSHNSHHNNNNNNNNDSNSNTIVASKLTQICVLLQAGAQICSRVWLAASEKFDVQAVLIEKLAADGYYLYKTNALDAALFRLEFCLTRISSFEKRARNFAQRNSKAVLVAVELSVYARKVHAAKYQTYLALSRCERSRQMFKRGLEYATIAILVDSTRFEAFYSKAQLLNDCRDFESALFTANQALKVLARTSSMQVKSSMQCVADNNKLVGDDELKEQDLNEVDDRKHGSSIKADDLDDKDNNDDVRYVSDWRACIERLREQIIANLAARSLRICCDTRT